MSRFRWGTFSFFYPTSMEKLLDAKLMVAMVCFFWTVLILMPLSLIDGLCVKYDVVVR